MLLLVDLAAETGGADAGSEASGFVGDLTRLLVGWVPSESAAPVFGDAITCCSRIRPSERPNSEARRPTRDAPVSEARRSVGKAPTSDPRRGSEG